MAGPVSAVLKDVMRTAKTQRAEARRLQKLWRRLVGRQLIGHSRPVSLRRGVLRVEADEPGASFLLSLEKPRLLKAIQEELGERLTDIVIRPGGRGELSR